VRMTHRCRAVVTQSFVYGAKAQATVYRNEGYEQGNGMFCCTTYLNHYLTLAYFCHESYLRLMLGWGGFGMTLKEFFANMCFVVLDFIIIIVIVMLCKCTSTLQFNRSRDRQYVDDPNATYASMALHGKGSFGHWAQDLER